MDIVEVAGVENARLGVEPVVERLRAHGEVPRGAAGIQLLACIRQLAGLVKLKESIADGTGVAAKVTLIRLR